jgi:glycosyltransferase involved in cell wall biosynthesis
MSKRTGKKNNAKSSIINGKYYPLVSVCTPTFNRRPFIPMMFECFKNQTYPSHRIEWIIVDDGTDKIEDLIQASGISQIHYFSLPKKMSLGEKRNYMHTHAHGNIIVYMDDDDYYPPERVSHAVEVLKKNPNVKIAGSSEMYLYFKHIQKMYKFGPYNKNHSTAATFAFRKELLKDTNYQDEAAMAEEKRFLKDYQIPLVQLDSMKSILVFSHIHNSLDKKRLLDQAPNQYISISDKKVEDFIEDPEIREFFLEKIDDLLENYEPGRPENKPEVLKQIQIMEEERKVMIQNMQQKAYLENIINNQKQHINLLTKENLELKDKNEFLNKKITALIETRIKEIKAGGDGGTL